LAIMTRGEPDRGLGAQATVGLLFPATVWLGVRAWRAMNRCSPVAVRALTDIAVSVMLGFTLVALMWLTGALHMPSTEVATVREALLLADKYADLPQWWWIGLYVLMAGASVLFARLCPQPGRLPVEATFSLLSRDATLKVADEPDRQLGA
jgi:hypothetical protein